MSDTTKTILLEPNIQYVSIATKCKICGEEIILVDKNNIAYDRFQICDKCRAAILKIRKEMEEENEVH